MTPFDLFNCPLSGVNLIEASAGAGKTHALAGLYLRLLVEKNMAARQALVITYTNAATAELKSRIRQMVASAQTAFSTGSDQSSPFLRNLLNKYADPGERKRIYGHLSLTLANFDEAAIYTIHGFCQRILMDNAFAGGVLFDMEFIGNQQRLEREFVEDFWRRRFYGNHPVIVQYALACNMNIDLLLELLRMVLYKPDLTIIPDFDPFSMGEFEQDLASLREDLAQFKLLWRTDREAIVAALRSKALSGVVYGKKVDGLILEIEDMTGLVDVTIPPPVCLRKLSAQYLKEKTKKNHLTPEHPFFNLCRKTLERSACLQEKLNRYLAGLKKEFLESARAGFSRLKRGKNVLCFDDLLLRASEALSGPGGAGLAELLRQQYRAALVDEFQDTDPLQFAILQSVFGTGKSRTEPVLFYIGDPKQAIYSFRGADIYAYLRAAKSIDHHYTMEYNWRSTASLINAINTLFGETGPSFVYGEIPYHRVTQAPELKITPLVIEGKDPAGLQWWFAPGGEDGKPLGVEAVRSLIYRAVVAEIAGLVHSGHDQQAFIGEKPLAGSDIAILVRKNTEAITFKKMLNEAGIPSVIYSAESVFSSDEAQELRRLLLGVVHHENEGYVLSALTTSFFTMQAHDIAACSEDGGRMDVLMTKFKNYSELWRTKGFLPMFNILLERESARPRIASFPDGERRLTNYAHLAEQLFQAQKLNRMSPPDLLKWLESMSAENDNQQEDQQLRLETDLDCIRIVTIHKSKGLEYPVCFCPFAWETGPKQKDTLPLCFHDEKNGWRATADLGSENISVHQELYDREVLAENCRLLYVALTRAKYRCYFVWGNIKDTQSSAVSYLFHRSFWLNQEDALSNGDLTDQINALAVLAPEDIRVVNILSLPVMEKRPPEKGTEEISYREFTGRISHRWKIASYTYLTQVSQDGLEWDEEIGFMHHSEAASEARTQENILFFPPGVTSGILLHEILEKLDFTGVREEQARTLVQETLQKFDYSVQWQPVILKMLEELVHAELTCPGGSAFNLSRVDKARCLKEVEFYFPLRDISPAKLMSVLEQSEHRQKTGERKKLNFPPVQGFLKGFIDLVFEYNGWYFLADWKSNDLGERFADYAPDHLEEEMSKSFYDLQYLIYTVALHRYLKKRLPGYAYEKHFGGVYYFFLRGVNSEAGRSNGIFFARPSEKLIEQAEKALLPG